MKPPVLRRLDEIEQITSHITLTGDSSKFLNGVGEYISVGASHLAPIISMTANNQTKNITVELNGIYLINTSSFASTKITIKSTASFSDCVIKNIGATNNLTITTKLDNITNLVLAPYQGVRVIWNGTNWYII